MSLQDRLTADMKAAMKAGDRDRLGVIRMLIADLKQEQFRTGRDTLKEDEEIAVLRKSVKTRRETVEQAEQAGRDDIATKEKAEITLIESYLPQMMSPDELREKVKELAAEVGYAGPQDKGKFMKAWMAKYKGLAEGRDVQSALNAL